MKTLLSIIAVFAIITSVFAGGTASNFTEIQSKRTMNIDAQINGQIK